ncbi:putative ribonuclease H-like domain-containing protein, partial [Tanacetum coccineum]
MGHFSKECRASRNKEGQFRNQDNTRKHGNNEDTSSKAMLAIYGVGFDYSYMAEEQHEKEGIEFKIEKFDKASKDQDKLLGSEITYKSKKGLGYNVVPPPHPIIYNRPKKLDLSYSGLDEFKDPEFKNASKENSDESLIKEQVSEDTSSFVESPLNVDKKIVFLADKNKEFVKPKNHEKQVKKSVRTHPNAQRNMVPRAVLMKIGLKPFNTARTVNTAHPKSIVFSAKPMSHFSKTAQSTVRRPFQSKTVLSNKRFTQKVNTAKAQAINTARPKAINTARPKAVKTARPNCAVVNAVRILSQLIACGCSRHMTGNIAYLSDFKEFDGGYVTFGGHQRERMSKPQHNDKGFVDSGCSRHMTGNIAYVTFGGGSHGGRISGKGTLKTDSLDFEDVVVDIDSLTQSMNYVPVAAGTISNESAGTQGELNAGTYTQKEEISQDCIVMPIWKDALYFDSPSKDVDNGEPKSAADDQKQVEHGPHNESDKSKDDSSTKEVNDAGQHVNTASPRVNTGSPKLNTVDPSVSTASSNDQDSPKDMFKMGTSHTLEATPVEFFSDEDQPEVDLGNILNSYTVSTTPNTRIHKDHPINNVISDVKSTIEPISIAKALSDSSWVEAMKEELFQFKLQQVWIVVDLPIGKRAIGTKWGHRQEKGIDYEGVFAPVARIEAIRLFLAYVSFMGFLVYQMDVKSAFLYGTIEEEVY